MHNFEKAYDIACELVNDFDIRFNYDTNNKKL